MTFNALSLSHTIVDYYLYQQRIERIMSKFSFSNQIEYLDLLWNWKVDRSCFYINVDIHLGYPQAEHVLLTRLKVISLHLLQLTYSFWGYVCSYCSWFLYTFSCLFSSLTLDSLLSLLLDLSRSLSFFRLSSFYLSRLSWFYFLRCLRSSDSVLFILL